MIILLSLVFAIQACLTLWLYRKVTKLVSKVSDMQAGILIAKLGSWAELEELKTKHRQLDEYCCLLGDTTRDTVTVLKDLKADVKTWKIRVASVSARLDAKADAGDMRRHIQTKYEVAVVTDEEVDAYRKWRSSYSEDPSFDEQYQHAPDPPDDRNPDDTENRIPDDTDQDILDGLGRDEQSSKEGY